MRNRCSACLQLVAAYSRRRRRVSNPTIKSSDMRNLPNTLAFSSSILRLVNHQRRFIDLDGGCTQRSSVAGNEAGRGRATAQSGSLNFRSGGLDRARSSLSALVAPICAGRPVKLITPPRSGLFGAAAMGLADGGAMVTPGFRETMQPLHQEFLAKTLSPIYERI